MQLQVPYLCHPLRKGLEGEALLALARHVRIVITTLIFHHGCEGLSLGLLPCDVVVGLGQAITKITKASLHSRMAESSCQTCVGGIYFLCL